MWEQHIMDCGVGRKQNIMRTRGRLQTRGRGEYTINSDQETIPSIPLSVPYMQICSKSIRPSYWLRGWWSYTCPLGNNMKQFTKQINRQDRNAKVCDSNYRLDRSQRSSCTSTIILYNTSVYMSRTFKPGHYDHQQDIGRDAIPGRINSTQHRIDQDTVPFFIHLWSSESLHHPYNRSRYRSPWEWYYEGLYGEDGRTFEGW